jgi:hypothetical protein
MTYPQEFYYTEKSSESDYSYTPQGTIEVTRLINGKSYWKKDLAAVTKTKTIILADWTAVDWPEDKITAVIVKINKMITDGFVVYMQDGEKIRPLKKTELFRLNTFSFRQRMSPPISKEALVARTVKQNPKLSPSKIEVLDEYSIEGLLEESPGIQRERGWPVYSLRRLGSKTELMKSLILAVKPPVTYFQYKKFPVDIDEQELRLEEYFPSIKFTRRYKSLSFTIKQMEQLLEKGQLTINNFLFDLSHLEHVELLTVECEDAVLNRERLDLLLSKIPKIKSLTLSSCRGLSTAKSSIKALTLKNITLEFCTFSSTQIQQLVDIAPSLTHLKFDGINVSTNDDLKIPSLEFFTLIDINGRIPNTVIESVFKHAKKLNSFSWEGSGPDVLENRWDVGYCSALEHISIDSKRLSGGELKKIVRGSIRSINIKNCRGLTNFDASDLPELLQLDRLIINDTDISVQTLENILAKAPQLKECCLHYISKEKELDLNKAKFYTLETLTLYDVKLHSVEALYVAIEAIPNLTSLHLRNLDFSKPSLLPSVSLTQLQELSLTGTISGCLFDFLADAPVLEELNLTRCNDLPDPYGKNVTIPALRKLKLSDTKSINAEVLQKIISGSPNLIELDLGGTKILGTINPDAVSFLMLKKLNLMNVSLSTIKILLKQVPNLEVLCINRIQDLDLHSFPPINLPSLKQLTLSFSDLLPTETVHAFLTKAPNLQELDLSGSTIEATWGEEKYDLPYLEKINLSAAIISEKALFCLLKSAPNLKEITLSHTFASHLARCWSIETRQALLDSKIKIVGLNYLLLSMLSEQDNDEPEPPSELDEYLATIVGGKPAAPDRNPEELGNRGRTRDAKPDAAPAGQALPGAIANLFKKEQRVFVDPIHDPRELHSFTPTQDDYSFQFTGKNTSFNQTMIIEKLSQYLTITNQHKAHIAKIQDGICNALTRHFITMSPIEWQALIKRIQAWNGSYATLTDPLSADFKELWDSVAKNQFRSTIPTNYLGDNLKPFLESQKTAFILSNPWHAIGVNYSTVDKSWALYDPNFASGTKTAKTVAELELLIKQSLGTLVFVDNTFAASPLINNVNDFLRDGGLLALTQADNISDMLPQLITFRGEYTKEALDGLLLRSTSGIPSWLKGIKTPLVTEYTLNLLLKFQEKNSDSAQQLQRSMQAMSPHDRHESLVALIQLKKSFPHYEGLLQELSTKLRPLTTHDYRRELETWRKPTSMAPSIDAYCLQLVAKKPNKKQLIALDSNANTNALSLALLNHCLSTSRPVFTINSPDDLVCSASWVERQADGSGLVRKGPGGPLYDFLRTNKGKSPVLVVRYDRFKADDIVRYNSLLDTMRKADGAALSKDVTVLGLINPNDPKAYQGSDFYSRFDEVGTCPLGDEVLKAAVPKNPPELALEATTGHFLINLAHSSDWEGRLLGRWVLKKDQLIFEEGELSKALKTQKPICLQNAPWDDARFQIMWQQIIVQKSITHSGRTITIPKGIIRSRTEGYDWNNMVSYLRFAAAPSETKPVVVNPQLLRTLFYSYKCDPKTETLDTLPGLLEQNKKGNLALYLTRNLNEDEWGILLLACREKEVTLSCQLAPGVTLPAPLKHLFPDVVPIKTLPTSAWHKTAKSNPLAISSTDVAATVALTTHDDADWVVIDISECEANALLGTIDGKFKPEVERFFFGERLGAVQKALAENKKVLLHGSFSEELMDCLAPLLLKTASPSQLPPGQLVLVSNSAASFNYCSTMHHEVTQKEKLDLLKTVCKAKQQELDALPKKEGPFNHLRAHLTYQRAFTNSKDTPWQGVYKADPIIIKPFDAEHSKEKADAFLKQRIDDVKALLSQAPYVCITGLTGIGKTSFIEKHLAKEPGIKVYQDIKEWMNDKTPGRKKILLLDEYNLIQQQLNKMEGLFNNPPGILHEGIYTTLTSEHKLVCLGNPLSTGGERQDIPFIEHHGNALAFGILSPEFIYEYVLKPVFAGTSLAAHQLELVKPVLDAYGFIAQQSKTEVLISPRELEMMVLMAVSYAKQHPETSLNDHKLAIQHYVYRLGLQLNKTEHRENFEAHFKPEKPLAHDRLPQYKAGFLVTESRKAISQQLDDLLALREFRCSAHATTSAQKYGGLGGLIIDGEAGIGKSELAMAGLFARGYQEVHLESTSAIPEKPFYHMPVSMQLEDKIRLLLKAFNEGAVVLIDEINSSPMMERLLNSLLMGKTLDNKSPDKPGFCIIGTQNPPTLGGRFIPSNALSRRLINTGLPPYTTLEMQDILIEKKVDRDEAIAMVKAYEYNRNRAEREILNPAPTFRDLLRFAQRVIQNRLQQFLGTKDEDVKEEEIKEDKPLDKPILPKGIKKLGEEIQKLRKYGQKLAQGKDDQSKTEGNKAIVLADKLHDIAKQFTKTDVTSKQQRECRNQFREELYSGYREMATHRAFWKPLFINIAIAATGIGLLLIVGKLLTTGSPFFSTTKRQEKIQNIKGFFENLDDLEGEQDLTAGPTH